MPIPTRRLGHLVVLGLLVAASACSASKDQQQTSFPGNWRVQLRTSVNGLPSIAQSGNTYVMASWLYDDSFISGSHTAIAGYTDSAAYLYGTSSSFNSVWQGYSDFCDGFGTLESDGEFQTLSKGTSFLICDVSEGSFYYYDSGHSGYLSSWVPDDWTDQTGNVAGPGDPGTLPPPAVPSAHSVTRTVAAAESVADDSVDPAERTDELSELSSSDLYPDDYIDSPDGTIRLLYQDDGNLVIYDMTTDPWTPLWSTGTVGDSTGMVSMQGDGNLVVYDGDSSAVWSSGTSGNDGAYLALLDTGDLMVLRTDGFGLWWSASGEGAPNPTPVAVPEVALRDTAGNLPRQRDSHRSGPWFARRY